MVAGLELGRWKILLLVRLHRRKRRAHRYHKKEGDQVRDRSTSDEMRSRRRVRLGGD
jgi:hypothetical protein